MRSLVVGDNVEEALVELLLIEVGDEWVDARVRGGTIETEELMTAEDEESSNGLVPCDHCRQPES